MTGLVILISGIILSIKYHNRAIQDVKPTDKLVFFVMCIRFIGLFFKIPGDSEKNVSGFGIA